MASARRQSYVPSYDEPLDKIDSLVMPPPLKSGYGIRDAVGHMFRAINLAYFKQDMASRAGELNDFRAAGAILSKCSVRRKRKYVCLLPDGEHSAFEKILVPHDQSWQTCRLLR